MFKEKKCKPRIEVIGVSHQKNPKAKSMPDFSTYSTCVKIIVPPYTTVLFTVDGVLKTKDFDGIWTLDQVDNWTSI